MEFLAPRGLKEMNMKKYVEATLLDLLRVKSIDKIKVNEVIRVVGTCKSTFYKYYKDKYELLISCFRNNYYDELIAKASNWEEFVLNCIGAFERIAGVVINSFDSRDVNSVRFYHEKIISEFLLNDIRKSSETTTTDEFAVRVCSETYTDIMLEWLESRATCSKESVLEFMKTVMPHSFYSKIYAEPVPQEV